MIDLPANPVDGQEVTFDDRTWVWRAGVGGHIGAWDMKPVSQGDANLAAASASAAHSSELAAEAAAAEAIATLAGKASNTDLANTTDETKGAGRIGFSFLLDYAAGTLGNYIKSLVTLVGLSTAATVAIGGFNKDDAQTILDNGMAMQNYAAMQAYTGRATGICIRTPGLYGAFRYNAALPNTSNGGTRFAHASGTGAWERLFDGAMYASWFGAAAGVDSTAALTSAIAAFSSSGGELRLPRGLDLSGTITINKPITVVGEGFSITNGAPAGTVVRKLASLNGPAIVMASAGTKLQNFTLQGVVGNGGDGIVMADGRSTVENVAIFQMGSDGLRIGLTDGGPSNLNHWRVNNLFSKNNGRHGVNIDDKILPILPDANAGTLNGADLQFNAGDGLHLGNCRFNTFIGLTIQRNGTYGVRCTPSSMFNTFFAGDYEANGRAAIDPPTLYYDFWIEAGSLRNLLLGGVCYNFPQTFKDDEPSTMRFGVTGDGFGGADNFAGLKLANVESSDARSLDWYEQGTFTPVIEGITSAGVGTYSTQAGTFTRIGNVVTAVLTVAWSAHTGTGNMRVGGLPFTSHASANFQPATITPADIATPANSTIAAMVLGNSKYINLYSVGTAGVTTFAALAMDTNGTIRITVTYLVP